MAAPAPTPTLAATLTRPSPDAAPSPPEQTTAAPKLEAAPRPADDLFAELAQRRAEFDPAEETAVGKRNSLLGSCFKVYDAGLEGDAVAARIVDESDRLDVKFNKRSHLEHRVIALGFSRASPAVRSIYAKALRGGKLLKLSHDQFCEEIAEPSKGGGIAKLVKVCREFEHAIVQSETAAEADGNGDTAQADTAVAAHTIVPGPEFAESTEGLHAKPGELVDAVLEAMGTGEWRAVRCLGRHVLQA